MLLDGVREVSLTLLLEFLLLLAHIDRVLLVELHLLAGHGKWLQITLLSVVRFHVQNVNLSKDEILRLDQNWKDLNRRMFI